jgi:hypothetical protein
MCLDSLGAFLVQFGAEQPQLVKHIHPSDQQPRFEFLA